MRVLIQRVKKASVLVNEALISEIGTGLLLFVGIGFDDGSKDAGYAARKIAGLRIFSDEQGKMNRNVLDAQGEVLSVPQFTLFADIRHGNRPGFDTAAEQVIAKRLWEQFNQNLCGTGIPVKTGVFGADMEVCLVNDGPVTIWLDSRA